jgi:hypothetical protein
MVLIANAVANKPEAIATHRDPWCRPAANQIRSPPDREFDLVASVAAVRSRSSSPVIHQREGEPS